MTDDDRRLKIVRIDRELLAAMFKTGAPDRYVRCVDGLPEDAEFVGLSEQLLFDSDQIALKFRSKEFPVVPLGHSVPWANPLYSAVEVTAADLKFLADNPEWKRGKVPADAPGGFLIRHDVATELGLVPAAPHVVGGGT